MPHICLSCPAASGASLFTLSPFALFSPRPATSQAPPPILPLFPLPASPSTPGHHLHPSKPHSNVLRNYSEVNRAGCRNEITAAGLSARAREAIRQQEMTRRLHQQPTAAAAANPATTITANLHPQHSRPDSSRPSLWQGDAITLIKGSQPLRQARRHWSAAPDDRKIYTGDARSSISAWSCCPTAGDG